MDVNLLEVIGLFLSLVVRAGLMALPLFLVVLAITTILGRWIAPWARQTLWSVVLLRLLLLVSVGSSFSVEHGIHWMLTPRQVVEVPVQQNARVQVTATDLKSNSANLVESQVPERTIHDVINTPAFAYTVMGVLLLCMGFTLIWTAVTTARLHQWVRKGKACEEDSWLTLLEEGKETLGVTAAVRLKMVEKLSSPATYGWWRPMILLPADANSWSVEEMQHVLRHELAHIRRHDVLANWLLAVVRVMHWWNPVFWLAQRAWLAERELACDAIVLKSLDSSGVRQYGETLLKFLERLSEKEASLPTTALGFVLFMGPKQAVRRRLAELGRIARPQSRLLGAVALAMIAALGAFGLTDAAAEVEEEKPVKKTPLEVPEGALWRLSGAEDEENDAQRISRVYELAEVIERIRKDDPELTGDVAATALQETLDAVVSTPNQKRNPVGSLPAKDIAPRSKCVVQGKQLVVYATEKEHADVARLLDLWGKYGQRQVSVDTRFLSTTISLKELLPEGGGAVINGADKGVHSFVHGGPEKSDSRGIRQAEAKSWTEHLVPAYIKVLTPKEAESVLARSQGDARSNLLQAPKVTLFDGMSAAVSVGTQRPFVMGVKSIQGDNGQQVLLPDIQVVDEGLVLKLQPEVLEADKSNKLFVQYEMTKILSVDTFSANTWSYKEQTSGVSIQVPHVSRLKVTTEATIPEGHWLLVAPLEQDDKGQMQICLLKPLVIK